jgi:hypothetical protein
MKVSEIIVNNVAEYLKLEDGEYKPEDIQTLIDVSKAFISGYTGLDDTAIDTHNDFVVVVYYNRSMYVDKNNLNNVVDTILGMHCINFL